ncbi:carbohydrate ABC transporter permease [Halopelagius longus]|uniref:Carbohydrate ABC transporter membrane protein 2, CUT1 family n=1 Tax=Halopelagius longus TaxID=1236180 RepID=A0A1H1G8D5_9EURY|nr:carbohydrate ABC transporter permease [Halopelagius longus]RDI69782.1 carbohydrate ABC transporter permease [Halopelagius longus]SDR09403.1 carbohydrate ABC transporter membrane protein 2, CUT1 family [Halopelagius longus]
MSTQEFDVTGVTLKAATYGVISFLVLFNLTVLVFIFSVSFMPPTEFFGDPHIIPKDPTLEAWTSGFAELRDNLVNSFLIGLGTTIVALAISIPGAYAFARKEFYGKKLGFYAIISAMMFPYILLVIPIMDLWNDLGLYNTIPGMILAYQVFVTPFAIWILRDFFAKLPKDIEEAAQVYGCTQFTAFLRVILPLATPGIVAVGFLAFLTGWNDFLFANLLTTGTGPVPAVPVLYGTIGGGSGERVYWGKLMAETLIIGTPPTILYLVARNYLENAFTV